MHDALQRSIDYARISVTDRCNLRCVYCMPPEGLPKQDHDAMLRYEEILAISNVLASLGICKIKLTGGEPLVRRGLPVLAAKLKQISGIDSVTLTTNGLLLPTYAQALRTAGVDGVNISLDSLNAESYARMSRGGKLQDALCGLDAALRAGFPSVKINCVTFAGRSEAELMDVASLAKDLPVHVRFIEIMPLGMGVGFQPFGRERLYEALRTHFGPLEVEDSLLGNGPARYCRIQAFRGAIGFIETLDHTLCSRCNRLRLTADGTLKTCLHMDRGISLKDALQQGPQALHKIITGAIHNKPEHHLFGGSARTGEQRIMSQIGG